MFQHLRFDAEKAVQAAGVLLRNEGKRMSRLRLLKLLVIADRKCLEDTGRPILGSKVVAMKNGPLHSDVYDLIKGSHQQEPVWSRYIGREGPRDVFLESEPAVGRLSKHEIELLISVSDMHAQMDDFAISMLTHDFEEFATHYQEGTSRPIPLEAIIAGVGRKADSDAILDDLRDDEAWDRFFSESNE